MVHAEKPKKLPASEQGFKQKPDEKFCEIEDVKVDGN
jgi:hypothetical protein